MAKKICLAFDLDGTLTKPRNPIEPEMTKFIQNINNMENVDVAIVSGSDVCKIQEQLTCDPLEISRYCFGENGVVALENGQGEIGSNSFSKYLGEENLMKLLNRVLFLLSQIELPVKRGTFVEYRRGMLNISPIGRACSQSERDDFAKYDEVHQIRQKLKKQLEDDFGDSMNLQFSIGGQISIDVFPKGWDKRYCLKYLDHYDEIHFFGDKVRPGGNDHEIYEDDRTVGHEVTDFHDTIAQVKQVLGM